MIKDFKLTCPRCRTEHYAEDVQQIPVNYDMEEFIRRMNAMQLTAVDKGKRSHDGPPGISNKLQSLLEEQKASARHQMSDNQKVQSSLLKYHQQLRGWKVQHQQIQDRLDHLVQQNKEALVLLEEEDSRVTDRLTEGEEGRVRLQTMLESLDTVNTAKEMVSAIDEAEGRNTQAQDWNQTCREQFPDVNTVHTSIQVSF